MNAKPINWPQGRYNPGGLTKVYYQFVENFATFPTLADPEEATTLDSLVEYAAAATLKPTFKIEELYCTVEEGELKTTMVGDRDGKGFENTLTIFFPGSEAEFLGFKAASANRQLIFFVKEKNGKVRVLGNLEDPAYMDADESTSGKKIADRRGSTVTFKSSSATPAPIYKTALTSLLTAQASS